MSNSDSWDYLRARKAAGGASARTASGPGFDPRKYSSGWSVSLPAQGRSNRGGVYIASKYQRLLNWMEAYPSGGRHRAWVVRFSSAPRSGTHRPSADIIGHTMK